VRELVTIGAVFVAPIVLGNLWLLAVKVIYRKAER
jgi:hypothetical protein